jgi:SAM-dependent methyltransferase
MTHEKFDPARLDKLNDPARLARMEPGRIWAAAGKDGPAVIVEIGAGTGIFAARFAELAPQSTVYAVDTEPLMVGWMERHRAPSYGGRLVPVLSDSRRVPLADGIADVVFMIDLHHELDDPKTTYGETFRLLRGGGALVVVDWLPGAEGGGPPHEIRAGEEEIAATLGRAGFERVAAHDGPSRHSMVTAAKPRGGASS